MPNHITNYLEIKHKDPKMMEWIKTCWIDNGAIGESFLDFTKIIPPPNTSAYNDEPSQKEAQEDATWWYTWNVENWGTKWNSYEGVLYKHKDAFVCKFDTAWKPPYPIFDKLRAMGFEVNGLWKDECSSGVYNIGSDDHNWVTKVTFDYLG